MLPMPRGSLVGNHRIEDNSATLDVVEVMPLSSVAISQALLTKRTFLFCWRIVLAFGLIALSSSMMLSQSPILFIVGLIVQGAMYVHLIELQHSVLHSQVSRSVGVSRIIGFLLGLPMLISYSDFRYRHLQHHKHLGTMRNSEAFSYQRDELNSIGGFVLGALNYSRLTVVCVRLLKSFNARPISDSSNRDIERSIKLEYQLFALCLVVVFGASLWCSSIWPVVVWLLPLLVAEPVHFLLELPEHYGLPAHTNPNVFENTRSWGGSWFTHWFTHYTNFHVAHHFNQLVPMDNLPELQKQLEHRISQNSKSASYPDFFLSVMRGDVRNYAREDESA